MYLIYFFHFSVLRENVWIQYHKLKKYVNKIMSTKFLYEL